MYGTQSLEDVCEHTECSNLHVISFSTMKRVLNNVYSTIYKNNKTCLKYNGSLS